ncbi:hypothetical protein EVC45_21960 [Paraburkholderia sp. UYCP14C]|uniref:hypothetical protein n=1 Tax=Paraburkholderia sp. UYCP14C TaxID=2511130 RepID=UPI00102244CA|nr:hypothetical protein [Paraburkholderia sp. UYCP14C]RZF27672.1 hypothetical protein EVC45_21960 [Paraburkholderia sp. UYCP14C]
MQQSVSGRPEKTDELVRMSPGVVFHRDVLLPAKPPQGSKSATDQLRRVTPDAQYLMLTGKRPVRTPEKPLDGNRCLSMSKMFRESGFLIRTYDDLLNDAQQHALLTG